MKRLEDKAALISGPARGRDRAAAPRFAAEGAFVVGGDLLHEEAVETRRLSAREGGTALTPGPLDVTAEESVRSWVAEAPPDRWPKPGPAPALQRTVRRPFPRGRPCPLPHPADAVQVFAVALAGSTEQRRRGVEFRCCRDSRRRSPGRS
ncbi:hypothetical protein [Streptomyces sp. WELS2]|uniref:hypothetical protein n=1 Tax=Streptomyces sp. WELS2 TaxID=2749435 RepID=UPI0015F08E5C|nr:hypothetical protein [Streptomyces sp. WELS2]